MLLLVAPNERKVWIATGYGAGAYMTDAMSGLIIREAILPHFKQNPPDYGGGIEAGADAVIKQMSLPPDQAQKNVAAAQQAQQQRPHSGGSALPVLLLAHVRSASCCCRCSGASAGRRYRARQRRHQPLGGAVGPERTQPRFSRRLGRRIAHGAVEVAAGGGGGGGFSGGGGSFGGGGASGSVVMQLTESDHDKVSAAIAAAEAKSDGEIVAVATPISDAYHDVALHWALIPLFAVLAWAAWRPTALEWWYNFLLGGWQPEPTLSALLTLLMVFAALKFTVALLILKWMPLRLALTPAATKHRRVRRRAVLVFKAAAERRTVGRTGVLIYLSMAERRAEIVADEAIRR